VKEGKKDIAITYYGMARHSTFLKNMNRGWRELMRKRMVGRRGRDIFLTHGVEAVFTS